MYIESIVEKIKNNYRTNNPFEIADLLDIILIECKLGPELRGTYHYYKRQKIIYINEDYEEASKRITCAHELGHGILHPRENTMFLRSKTFFNGGRLEIEADEFAALLLLNDEDKEVLFEYGSIRAAQILCVPEEFLLYKFKDYIPEEYRRNCRRSG
ncbi:MAG: ImmA/IrrE family metallo-endopeptidase [bacterium]